MKRLWIDAYNVICSTDSLNRALKDRPPRVARDLLAERVRSIHDVEGVHLVIVLDSPNNRFEVEHPYGKKSFEFVYALSEVSADGAIERMLARVSNPGEVTVVTNDRMIRESAYVHGAIAMRPKELFAWACRCDRRLTEDNRRRKVENAKSFFNRIDLNF